MDEITTFAEEAVTEVKAPDRKALDAAQFLGKARKRRMGRPPKQAKTMEEARIKTNGTRRHIRTTTFDLGEGALSDVVWFRQHTRSAGKKAQDVLLTLLRAYRARIQKGPR